MHLPSLDVAIWICLGVVTLSLESVSDNPVASDKENDGREGKYLSETWHAVHTIPEGASGWIPRDPPKQSGPVSIKRRRLVKKKRRPPITTYLDQNSENVQADITHPGTGYSIKSSWDELMDDQSLKPYQSRKRVTPSDQDTMIKVGSDYNPVGATIHFGSEELEGYEQQINKQDRVDFEDLQPTTTTKKPNLKEILKQNGGLSLSEILQKKNITLAELLMGKKDAIKALTESSERISISTQTPRASDSTTIKYKRIPPSTALKKDIVDRKPESFDLITSKEIMEAQKKRLTLLQGRRPMQSGKLQDVKRVEGIIETTTVKDREEFFTEPYKLQSTEKASPSTEPTTLKPSKGLPITSAKLLKMVSKKPATTSTMETIIVEEENYPKIALKPLKIDPKEAIGYPVTKSNQKASSGPFHITIDLENIVTTTTTTESYKDITTTPQEADASQSNSSAKDEILQILKDPRGRIGLSRILEARNMTLQELIEQRERGSSQLHLADIFHNNTKEPEPLDEPLEGKISSEEFPNFPVFVRRPKELQLMEEVSTKPDNSSGVPNLPRFKIPATVSEEVAQAENFPWQKLYPELFSESSNSDHLTKDPVKQPVDSFTDEDLKVLEDVDQTLYSSASNEETPIVDETPRKIINISSGVKSAIYASLAIILLSMLVFVTILVVFRWAQRRKKKNNLKDNLKPALLPIKCGNLKSFVSETLQRKKSNYYKRHLQSMSDDSWERASRTNAF